MREDADQIIREAIHKVLPDEAVAEALKGKDFGDGRVYVVAAGKAAWQMAKAASDIMGDRIEAGVVVTKYDHVKVRSRRWSARRQDIPFRMRIPSAEPRKRWSW